VFPNENPRFRNQYQPPIFTSLTRFD